MLIWRGDIVIEEGRFVIPDAVISIIPPNEGKRGSCKGEAVILGQSNSPRGRRESNIGTLGLSNELIPNGIRVLITVINGNWEKLLAEAKEE